MQDTTRPIDILLVEDNPADVRLAREGFRATNSAVCLHVVSDGVEAMAFLRQQGIHAGAPRPSLILLDLSLPKMNGTEVLAELDKDPDLKLIPTIVMTSSERPEDVQMSYRLHANCYMGKPQDWENFTKVIGTINEFWLGRAKLPVATLPTR